MRTPRRRGIAPVAAGAIAIILVAIAFYMNFSKELPWSSPYEVQAHLRTANNMLPAAPVRIAGINVGKVTKIDQIDGSEAAVITMEIEDRGRPVREDATLKVRPRLFLEGNFFIDLKPGTPSRPELEDGATIPADRTATPVQVDELFTALQSDTRSDLQSALKELGDALEVHGGAKGFNDSLRNGARAFRETSRVNEALLGVEEHDLSGFIANTGKVARGLARSEEVLKDFVTNFRVTAGAFAAEDAALEQSIAELPRVLRAARPALDNLNAAFPPLRAWAREMLPGTRSTGPTLDVSTPFIRQARRLVSRNELRGLIGDLRPTIPQLASLTADSVPLFEQIRPFSNCFVNVVVPWGNSSIPDAHHPPPTGDDGKPVTIAEQTTYGLVGIGGESRSGDANGQLIHVQPGGGTNTVSFGPQEGFFGTTLFPILGAQPAITSSAKTPFKPDEPCENQAVPDLRAGALGDPPEQQQSSSKTLDKGLQKAINEIGTKDALILRDRENARELRAQGKNAQAAKLERSVAARQKRFDRTEMPKLRKLLGLKGGKR